MSEELRVEIAGWKAVFYPSCGGQLVRLCHVATNRDVLHFPENFEQYQKIAVAYGLPVLFPPNRIPNGVFCFENRQYRLPVNEASRSNNLHGFLTKLPWKVEKTGAETVFSLDYPASEIWPHHFQMEQHFRFVENHLDYSLVVKNLSSEDMPFMVGIHSAFQMNAGDQVRFSRQDSQFEMGSKHFVPTGKMLPSEMPKDFFEAGVYQPSLDKHFPVLPDAKGFRGVEFRYAKEQTGLRYSLGNGWNFWMCWNWNGTHQIFCPEPQTCMVNAANLKDTMEGTGFDFLRPGETRTLALTLDYLTKP